MQITCCDIYKIYNILYININVYFDIIEMHFISVYRSNNPYVCKK